ncbi:MAG: prepilin-type N-terminal cleavage/methylation domain-containing protein [Parcubacteria group bacterium]|jgi:Tfp pilus assembly protein PilW
MKNNKNKKNKNYQGFSLLEMLISVFIFVVTIITAVSIFVNVASARQQSRKIQKNMEDARTALDLMAKNMRMSVGLNQKASNEIYMFNSSQGICIDYKFEDGSLKMGQNSPVGDSTDCSSSNVGAYNLTPITSDNVSGKFMITQTSSTSDPKVIGKAVIIMKIDEVANIQTTVSFRDYNDIIQ